MALNHLPVIDWELCVKVAGDKEELAAEILQELMTNLSNDVTTIRNLYLESNYSALLRKVHKLHGAVCYSGLPRLKITISHLETALKNNIISSLLSLLDQLHAEVSLLLEHYSLHSDKLKSRKQLATYIRRLN